MQKNMKLRILIFTVFISMITLLAGCQRQKADEYLLEQINKKKNQVEYFQNILEEEIINCDSQDIYRIGFPEEAKKSYSSFIRLIGKAADYKVQEAEKQEDGSYYAIVVVTPVDISKTLQKANEEYAANMEGVEFSKAIEDILQIDKELLETSIMDYSVKVEVKLLKEQNGWSVEQSELDKIMNIALLGYMEPYTTVARAFNTRSYLQAYLDLGLKGRPELYAQLFDESEESVKNLYESIFASDEIFGNWDLDEEQKVRGRAATKKIYEKADYTLGTPTIEIDGTCNIPVRIRPNTCFKEVGNELQTNANTGMYLDMTEVAEGFIQLLEKYAEEPTYGESIDTVTKINYLSAIQKDEDGSWWIDLENMIIVPME